MDYYKSTVKETLKDLDTGRKGLSASEAKERLEKHGPNELEEKKGISPLRILLRQFSSPLIWILIGAVIISFLIGEKIDAAIILVILILNAIVGFIQEYRAEEAIKALKKMASLKATVIRDNKRQEIDTKMLVPGDMILLETGEKVPADARLIEASNLQTQEAALTGESNPVKKSLDVLEKNAGIGDRKNMVYSGTMVTKGRGKAVVTGTGMKTEIGKIAHMIQTTESESTPLQQRMAHLGKWLGILTLIICGIVFLAGIIRGEPLLDFFLVAVSLAVAAIPEGLPAVVTVSLALGVKRMVKRHALVRKLPSIETLGCTTVICTDKTGTLTHNQMTVRKIYVDNTTIDVGGSGYEPKGSFSEHTKTLSTILRIGALNNNSSMEEKDGEWKVIGDPTEGALIVSAEKLGLDHELLNNKYKRVDEIEFDSGRKRMTTIHEFHGKRLCYVKGAPDVILGLCSHIEVNGKIRKLNKEDKRKILRMNEYYADNALRVLGFAYKELRKGEKKKDYEKDLVFVGLQGMIDPPREEVKGSIEKCRRAGMKVVMITGDFKGTAVAIAKELGIPGKAVSGDELDDIDLSKEVSDIDIYARVNPEHKLRIVKALQNKGYVVAMTGDGVNDAPALKKADIGVSMGLSGTDVAKEASEMILTDDNFTSIVNAVEEGRGVYDNIKKFFAFLISGNIGEVMIIFLSILFGLPLPLTAVQILLINLVTDGLPAVALGADPFEPNAMERKPRPKNEPIYRNLSHFTIHYPVIMITVTLGLFYYIYTSTGNLAHAQTVAFLTIAAFEMYQAFASRSTRFSSFKVGIFRNRWLVGAVLISVIISMAVIYVPALQPWFDTFPLPAIHLAAVLLLSSLGFIYLELYKTFRKDLAR
ncbi:MAG: calcium-transporting P-type ATPase, PMR1-type [Candidatus Woesearchaeota archaeon]